MTIKQKTFSTFVKALRRKVMTSRVMDTVHGPMNVYKVPTSHIQRTGWQYRALRDASISTERDLKTVNHFRKLVRAKKFDKIHPVLIEPIPSWFKKLKPIHKYRLIDGHHRLTAHQAEGEKYIHALIQPKRKRLYPKPRVGGRFDPY